MIKRSMLILLSVMSVSLCLAQEEILDELMEKYSSFKGFTTVHITSSMMSLLQEFDSDDEEIDRAIKGLRNIKIISYSLDKGEMSIDDVYGEMVSKLQPIKMKALMEVKEQSQSIRFLVHEEKELIKSMIMIMRSEDETVLINLNGDLLLEDISNISKSLNISGMEKLQKLE